MKLIRKPVRAPAAEPVREVRTKLLISIVNKSGEKKLKEILDECSVALSFLFAGTGTAQSSVLDYLGIGETEKSVLCSLFPDSDEERIMRELRKRLSLYLAGRGISFTVPLAGISYTIASGLARGASSKTGGIHMEDRKYRLIVAAVGEGDADRAVQTAREAGAAGGTVIRARTYQNEKAEQAIGLSLMEERDILLILAQKESTGAIMEALSEAVGVKTEAGGIIFSLPVDKTAGISASEDEEQEE